MSITYRLDGSPNHVSGVGEALTHHLAVRGLNSIKDLLLFLPLRYEDRSQLVKIADITPDSLITVCATAKSARTYYKGPRSIQSATFVDETGSLKAMWFNNKFIIEKLNTAGKDQKFLVSGKLNDRGMFIQPVVEVYASESLHTNRIVPIYSNVTGLKQGIHRRMLKQILDHVESIPDAVQSLKPEDMSLAEALSQLHFPDTADSIIQARERLALEEFLALIKHSTFLKEQWLHKQGSVVLKLPELARKSRNRNGEVTDENETDLTGLIPKTVPFALTAAQRKACSEILHDLTQPQPMNRLLVGDVGSGKTVVAGIAAYHFIKQGEVAALIAPTKILAEQHAQTLQKLFPDLDVVLLSAQTKKELLKNPSQPRLVVGTHAVINQLDQLKPALIMYDEQHRFGVNHRSIAADTTHILTMTATPIPRTLMLTLFSHLQLSIIDELPKGRLPTKTWLVPEKKRLDSYTWIAEQRAQTLIVCPFIDPSNAAALENVAAVSQRFEEVKAFFEPHGLKVEILHGRVKKAEQEEITKRLYSHEIDILVTTPIVEVGIDIPTATVIVIEAAERFGLASLHQLRGRVGRANQQGYCLLFSTTSKNNHRLQQFTEILSGQKLAELDLSQRGAGDIFGASQHGFDTLQYGDWGNLELITKARLLYNQLAEKKIEWTPFITLKTTVESEKNTVAAN